MSNGRIKDFESEDYFAETRMSFGDHIEELRTHLWRAIIGFLFALVIAFFLGEMLVKFIAAPVEAELIQFYERRLQKVETELEEGKGLDRPLNQYQDIEIRFSRKQVEQSLKVKVPDSAVVPTDAGDRISFITQIRPIDLFRVENIASKVVGRRPTLTTLSVQEAFMVYFKVCLAAGLVLSSPWVFYQIWSFVAAGLYPHEKKYVNVFLPFSLGLFLIGVLVCQFIVIPKAIEALLWFNEWLGLEPDMRLNEWLGFAIMMPVVFGISFQTPLVMLFLERVGIMTVDVFKSFRRIAFFALAVFAAVATPSVDVLSMLWLWVPLCLLYELGIILIQLSPKKPEWTDTDSPESQELIEV